MKELRIKVTDDDGFQWSFPIRPYKWLLSLLSMFELPYNK